MKVAYILIFGVFVLFGTVTEVQGQNKPEGATCDITELVQWFAHIGDGGKWVDIFTGRNFTQLCREVDVLVRNVAGCAELVSVFEESIAKNLDALNNYLTYIQFYCGIAKPTQMCDINAMLGCATQVGLTTQEMITGSLDDARQLCVIYDGLVDAMDLCVVRATSDCTEAEKTDLLARYDSVFKYFRVVRDYCGQGCGEIIVFLANQYPGCMYIIDYTALDYSQYCTGLQRAAVCLFDLYSECTVGPPEAAAIGIDSVLLWADVFGCNLEIAGITAEDAVYDVALPKCAGATINCVKDIASFFGLSETLGPYGGYNWKGVGDQLDTHANKVVSGDVQQICDFLVDDIWHKIRKCAVSIIDGCPVGTGGDLARQIIHENITDVLEQACSQGCIDMATELKAVDQCGSQVEVGTFDIKTTTQDVLFALVRQGGANIDVCRLARSYVDCSLAAVTKCKVLWENYLKLVSRYSNIPYTISICNIKINLNDGLISTKDRGVEPLFQIEGGAAKTQASVICFFTFWIIIIALLV